MTPKQYRIVKLVIVVVIAIIFSQSIVMKNFFIPIATLVISSLVLLYLRKKIRGVMADERDYQTAGKAALLAIQIYAWIAVVCMFLMYSLQDINPYYESVAITLAFSTCILMLLYSLIFRYYNKIKLTDKKLIYIIVVFIIIFAMTILSLRVFSGEDSWMCKDGQWIEHGHPSYPAPQVKCE